MKSAGTNLAKFMIMSSTVIDCFNPLFIAVANIDNYSIPNITPNELLIRKGVTIECLSWLYKCANSLHSKQILRLYLILTSIVKSIFK